MNFGHTEFEVLMGHKYKNVSQVFRGLDKNSKES